MVLNSKLRQISTFLHPSCSPPRGEICGLLAESVAWNSSNKGTTVILHMVLLDFVFYFTILL